MQRNYVDQQDLVLPDMTMRHAIMISNCARCVVQIQGKVNSVTLGAACWPSPGGEFSSVSQTAASARAWCATR
jgi:hypothetical protein